MWAVIRVSRTRTRVGRGSVQPSQAHNFSNWNESLPATCIFLASVASRSPLTSISPRNRWKSGSRTAGSSTRRRTQSTPAKSADVCAAAPPNTTGSQAPPKHKMALITRTNRTWRHSRKWTLKVTISVNLHRFPTVMSLWQVHTWTDDIYILVTFMRIDCVIILR